MNIYDKQKWGVHVVGPDSVLAARSFSEANEKCHLINITIDDFAERNARGDHWPLVWAKVALWDFISAAPHEPDKTNWDEVC